MRKNKRQTTQTTQTKKTKNAKMSGKLKAGGKTGLRRVRLKGAKKSAARTHRDEHFSMVTLGGKRVGRIGLQSDKQETKPAPDSYLHLRLSQIARISSDSTILLYRISQRGA